MNAQQPAGKARAIDPGTALARVIAAFEAELQARIEVLESDAAPWTPGGGRLVRLADQRGVPEGWLRITPWHGHELDGATDPMVRVITRVLHADSAPPGSGLQRLTVESVRRVLEEQTIRMVYQPICDLYDGSIVGYEALARFPTPPRRSPDHWFGVAAAHDLGTELEVLALRQALRALDELPDDVYLSINLSPMAAISHALAEALDGVPMERVVLEITEHAEVSDYEVLNATIARLRRRGARLAVDDTGAGFASMRHVLRLAPDIVKLDTTLTQDIDNDSVLRALGFSLKSFAAAIDAQVVAEGIETERELDALRFLGVSHGQGFYLARPGPLLTKPRVKLTTSAG